MLDNLNCGFVHFTKQVKMGNGGLNARKSAENWVLVFIIYNKGVKSNRPSCLSCHHEYDRFSWQQ